MNPKIIFLKVKTNQDKLLNLTKTIEKHFDLNHKIIISTPNKEVASYIDQLIWRLPEESFIPHLISDKICQESVVITCCHENINEASVLINLSQQTHPSFHEYDLIYELYDETHPSKEELSKMRYKHYIESNFKVSIHE